MIWCRPSDTKRLIITGWQSRVMSAEMLMTRELPWLVGGAADVPVCVNVAFMRTCAHECAAVRQHGSRLIVCGVNDEAPGCRR